MRTSIEPLDDGDAAPVAAFIARLQDDPERHIPYLGEGARTVLAELSEIEQWRPRTLVARDPDGSIAGVVTADIDAELGRLYWLGPWAHESAVACALVAETVSRLGSGAWTQEEFAPDSRNSLIADIALGRGCEPAVPSSVLHLATPFTDATALEATAPLGDVHREGVIALHDEVFAGTHTPGARLVEQDKTTVRTRTRLGALVGYVAYEVAPDDTGYIDFLGVAEPHRRAGHGRMLVRSAVSDLAARGVTAVNLTVRADASGARDLYVSLGFVEERVITPYRRGFALP